MSRGAYSFKQIDVTRAIKAAEAAGKEVSRVEIGRDGRIVIMIGKGDVPPIAMATDQALERWLADED